MRYLIILLALFCFASKPHKDRRPSPPYITGDGFRAYCKFVFDKTNKKIDPSKVRRGDTIFVQTEYLPRFFEKVHPKIKQRYILVTHNSDLPIPGEFASYLDDPKLIAWFGQNVDGCTHEKLHPIPIGLENRYCGNGDLSVIQAKQKEYKALPKTMLLYNNFTLGTCISERSKVFEIFKDKSFCTTASRKPYVEYLKDLAGAKFILSPRGNGLDCVRTWEAFYMGVVPIIKHSASDSLYEGLPVILISDWNEVSEEFLQQKYEELQGRSYPEERYYLNYWLQQIKKLSQQSRV